MSIVVAQVEVLDRNVVFSISSVKSRTASSLEESNDDHLALIMTLTFVKCTVVSSNLVHANGRFSQVNAIKVYQVIHKCAVPEVRSQVV